MSDEKTFTQDEVNGIVQERIDRERRSRVEVSPRRVYALDAGTSFYADMLRAAQFDEGAIQRKTLYAYEVANEINLGTPEGRYAERCVRESFRHENDAAHYQQFSEAMREIRALATGGEPGGLKVTLPSPAQAAAFVTPFILLPQWAPFRGRRRPFADQCMGLPLPAYGMHGYIPAFTSATGASPQAEGATVQELTPSAALEGTEVSTAAGRLTLTQQFLDQAFGQSGHVDVFIGLQMLNQIEELVDQHVLNAVNLAGTATKVTGGATFVKADETWKEAKWKEVGESVLRFYLDLATAREQMADEAGTRLRPTHFFSTSDFYSYLTRLSDANGRPLLPPGQVQIPDYVSASGADADLGDHSVQLPKWSRFTGTVLPGGLLWFTDDNISKIGTTAKVPLYVSAPDEGVVVMEDPATTLSVFPETHADELKVTLIERKYVCAVIRRPAGTVVVEGNGYTEALK